MNDKKLWTVFSLYIRLKYANDKGHCKCYTCGAWRYYTACDAGHGISRRFRATKFDENNVRPQCKPCNSLGGGRPVEFKKAMDKEHGPGTWDLMTFKARQVVHVSQSEYDELERHYRAEVAKLKKERGLK